MVYEGKMVHEENAVKSIRSRRWVPLLLLLLPTYGWSLTVVLDDNYPPYSFRDSQGTLQGISVDLWNLWGAKTGEPVTLVGLLWGDALSTMDEGRADVLDTVFLTTERTRKWAFTAPYATIQTAVFQREGLTRLQKPLDLKGLLVGVKAGDSGADALREAGIESFVEYVDYESLIDAAARGEVLAFCMDVPPAVHFLLAKGLGTSFHQSFVVSQDSFHRAVSRDRPETLILVDRGFSLITAAESQEVELRWRGNPLNGGPGPIAVISAIVAGLVVIGLLVGLVLFLSRQVKHRTGLLAGTVERLKESEDRAQALVSALPDLLYILNRDGTIVETQATIRNHLYHHPERFVGKTISDVFGAEVGAKADARMADLEATGGVGTLDAGLEIRGERRTFEARIVRMADGRFLSIVRDVSDTRRAWQDDLHRNKLESLGLLAGGLAHDFNNSLAVIQGFVSLARVQVRQPEKALASLDKAVLATRRAAGLTSQLRVLAHGGEVHRTLLSVKTLAAESASFALVGSPCLLAIEADGGPWTVEADPDQLSQVFHNLVLNAVQAMPLGGTVTLVFNRTVGGKIVVSVVDEGEGIPTENLPRIFDPYFTTKTKGTGLGLSVVHAVVQRHGGSLEVDSRAGRGSVFTVTLPSAEGDPVSDNLASAEVPPEWAGMRVLLMEDEPDLRDLMVDVTTSLGFSPTACRNGTEAVAEFDAALADGRPYQLLVSDLLVPGDMGGRELISLLRTRPARFRALAVTGFSVDRSVEDFQNQGFDVIVGKPFTIDELKVRIVELMKSPWKTAPST